MSLGTEKINAMDIRAILFTLTVLVVTVSSSKESDQEKLSQALQSIIQKENPTGSSLEDEESNSADGIELYDLPYGLMEDKRGGALFRFGRGGLMRYGKRGGLMRYGKRSGSLFRFGRGGLMRYGKRNDEEINALAAGKRMFAWGKRDNGDDAKRLFRWGKRDDDLEEKRASLMRYGKREDSEDGSNEEEKRGALMRYGKRFSRDVRAEKPHVPFRFGRQLEES